MGIKGLDGVSAQEFALQLRMGARFVVFGYCISIMIMTFKRGSDVYYIRPGEGTFDKSIGYTLISLVLGWWGLPWGPIYTIGSLFTNLGGGKDVTKEVLADIGQSGP